MCRVPVGGPWSLFGVSLFVASWFLSFAAQAAVTESGGTVPARPIVETPTASLDRTSVPAHGREVVALSVEKFGRVAVLSHSSQGVSVQLVDRVAGPGDVSGVPGESDGRVEGFLDHGEYRVIVRGHEKGQGEARLEARPFRELTTGQPPMLPDLASLATTLADFEQRSWWLHVPERRNVAIEVAGRALGDLRLWRDGQWLVDAAPDRTTLSPDEGRPLTVLRLAPHLEPGLYLLTAYGGPAEPWAREDGSSPLLVRTGTRQLAGAHRQRHVMGALGLERFSVPGSATYFRVEVDESPASLGVGTFNAAAPFAEPDATERVTKESLPPIAEMVTSSRPDGRSLVTITAPPGKSYMLQLFDASDRQPIPASGKVFLATVHSGHPEDSVDATGILDRDYNDGDGRISATAESVIQLGASAAWARRFNLLDPTQVYFRVESAGEYQVDIGGVEAECIFEPFLIYPPEGYERPKPRVAPATWDLDAGLHVLTLIPRSIGIADVAVRPKAGAWDRLVETFTGSRPAGVPPLRPTVLFGEMTVPYIGHFLTIAPRPQIRSGLVLRETPVDLALPLPIGLPEGESLGVSVTVKEPSIVRADLEDGTLLPIALDGAAAASEVLLPAGGMHRVTFTAPATGGPRLFSVGATPQRAAQGLPALPASLAPKAPDLPLLVEGKPRTFDLAKSESRTFLMKAESGALYRVETTGLLATEGNLRTRTVTSLARSSSGGSGRNFLVQQYLRSGDYHVTVGTLGQSAGHLGLSLARAALREGGDLEDGIQTNVTLPAGEAIAFELDVPERSTWRLQAVALGRTLRARLEEEGGWPVVTPGGEALLTLELEPGRHRFIVLPEPSTVKVAVTATREADPPKLEGHGPFALPLDRTITHQWTESPEGAERQPDRWTIDMTGSSDVTISLATGMEARLAPLGPPEDGLPVTIRSARAWTGPLVGGHGYSLDVVSTRRDNLREYTLSARPAKLVPGMERQIVAPADIGLAFDGSASTPGSSLEITATGPSDVRARLLDASGRALALSDDAPDDWNFRFDDVPRDAARLVIEPVVGAREVTRVRMRARVATMPGASTPVPLDRTLDLGDANPELLLLEVPSGEGLLVVSALAGEEVSLEASVRKGDGRDEWTLFDRDAGRRAVVVVPMTTAPEARRALVGVRTSRGGRARVRLVASIARPMPADPSLGKDLVLGRVATAGDASVFAAALPSRMAALHRVELPRGVSLRLVTAMGARFRPVSRIDGEQLALASNEQAWLVATSREPAAASSLTTTASSLAIRARQLVLRPGAPPERLRLGRETIACEIEATPARTWRLCVVEAAGAQPLVAVDRNAPANARTGTAWPGGAASAGGEGPINRAWMRLADDSGAASSPARAFVVDLPLAPRDAPASSWNGVADPAVAWKLPIFPKLIRVSLDAGTFAVVTDGWEIDSVHGSTVAAVDETFVPAKAAFLHVVRLPGSTGRHAVEVQGPGAPDPRVEEGAPFEMLPSHEGRVRVAVRAGHAATLRVAGARAASLWRGPLDMISVGDGALLRAGETATLAIDHGADPVSAWLEVDGASAWGVGGQPATIVDVSAPASVTLAGVSQALRVRSGDSALLSLRTAQPIVTRVRPPGGAASESRAWPAGARLDAWVPAGVTDIDVRGFASAQLAGSATVDVHPGIELEEGVGEATFIPAGGARAFAFSLLRAARIGVGVRASSDAIETRLLDGAGALVGTGIVQMHDLEAARYVLVVSAPAADGPVSVKPVLVGIDERDGGPPLEDVRAYVLGTEPVPENAAPQPRGWHAWLGVAEPEDETGQRAHARDEGSDMEEGSEDEGFAESGEEGD